MRACPCRDGSACCQACERQPSEPVLPCGDRCSVGGPAVHGTAGPRSGAAACPNGPGQRVGSGERRRPAWGQRRAHERGDVGRDEGLEGVCQGLGHVQRNADHRHGCAGRKTQGAVERVLAGLHRLAIRLGGGDPYTRRRRRRCRRSSRRRRRSTPLPSSWDGRRATQPRHPASTRTTPESGGRASRRCAARAYRHYP